MTVFAMYLQLNDSEAATDRQRGLLAARLPPVLLRYLYSVAPVWEAPIDGIVTAAATMPTPEEFDLRHYRQDAALLSGVCRHPHDLRESRARQQ